METLVLYNILANEKKANKSLEFADLVMKDSHSQSDLDSKLEYYYASRDYLMDCMKYTEEARKISEKYINDPRIGIYLEIYLEINGDTFNKAKHSLELIDKLIEKCKTNLGIS